MVRQVRPQSPSHCLVYSSFAQVYLRNYFNRFPDFHYDETKETISQFKRLSRQQQWSQDERDDERDQLRTALVMQFNDSYGEDDEDIQGWQKLCQAINLDHTPESVTECKQVCSCISDIYITRSIEGIFSYLD